MIRICLMWTSDYPTNDQPYPLPRIGLPYPLIAAYTATQRETPHELLGRVAATASTLIFAPTGLALLLGSGMVAALDYRVQILSAGILSLTVAAVLVITGRRRWSTEAIGQFTSDAQEVNVAREEGCCRSTPRRSRH